MTFKKKTLPKIKKVKKIMDKPELVFSSKNSKQATADTQYQNSIRGKNPLSNDGINSRFMALRRSFILNQGSSNQTGPENTTISASR